MEMNEKFKEELLWKIAKKRVAFRNGLFAYALVNSMLWCMWFFTGRELSAGFIPWPVWPMFGWGIGMVFAYMDAYVYHDKVSAIEKEYNKLKQ